MKRRNTHSAHKARSHILYSSRDVLVLYGVCRNTLNNWIKRGLIVAGRASHRYFRGADLNAFHKACADERSRKCTINEVHCVACKKIHLINELPIRVKMIDQRLVRLHITCPDRQKITCKVMRRADLEQISHIAKPIQERKQQAIQ
jgi:DNA-binding transcriptional MerR regulator